MTLPEQPLVNDETTAPTNEPLSVADVRMHNAIDHDDDTASLESLIQAARHFVQGVHLRATTNTTFTYKLPRWHSGVISLPVAPLVSVTSVKYYDSTDTQQTYSSDNYYVETSPQPGHVELKPDKTWPTLYSRAYPIEIEYVAGYGTNASDVPGGLKQAMSVLIGTWYAHRETVIAGTTAAEVPHLFDNLIAPYAHVGV